MRSLMKYWKNIISTYNQSYIFYYATNISNRSISKPDTPIKHNNKLESITNIRGATTSATKTYNSASWNSTTTFIHELYCFPAKLLSYCTRTDTVYI